MESGVAVERLTAVAVPLACVLIGTWAGMAVERWRRKREKAEDGLKHVHELLLKLYDTHFWVVSAEMRGKTLRPERLAEFQDLSDRIVNELRRVPGVPQTERLLKALWSGAFRSERERHRELERVLHRLARRANPGYARAMRRLRKENEREFMRDPEAFLRRRDRLSDP